MNVIRAKELMRKEDLKKVSPEEKITSAISQLKSTHDAVFVCSEGQYLGAVNLYHSFLGKKWSQEQKVKACLYQPPRLSLDTPIEEISRLMVEARIYRLPVLSDNKLRGVVYAEDVLLQAADLRILSANTNMLIHYGSISLDDEHKAALSSIQWSEKESDKMIDIFAEKCINSKVYKEKNWKKMMAKKHIITQLATKRDWILNAQEATDYGFADGILGSKKFPNIEYIKNYIKKI